jgi:hypothetical protein
MKPNRIILPPPEEEKSYPGIHVDLPEALIPEEGETETEVMATIKKVGDSWTIVALDGHEVGGVKSAPTEEVEPADAELDRIASA